MSTTAADILVDLLLEFEVDTVFGIPGYGISGIMEALRKKQEQIRFIHVRHEESAAFAACGYSKFTGKLGVCLSDSGAGGIHLLNGLYDAKFDGASVLAITGLHHHDLLSTFGQHDVELDKLFQDVAVYSARIMGADHIESVTELACRMALTRRGVAHLAFPVDFQSRPLARFLERRAPSHHRVPGYFNDILASSARTPQKEAILQAVEILNQGRKIAILAGQGALNATDELLDVAEKLGAPIIKALLGKAVVPDDHLYTTGSLGLLGTRPSQEVIENCDTLLMVGTSFPYTEFLPPPGKSRAVQIDISPVRIGLRYPVDIGLVGDSQRTLQALLPYLNWNSHREFLHHTQARMKDWWDFMKTQGTRTSRPMKPQVVAWELGQRLSSHAIVTGDCGTTATWWSRHIPVRRGQMYSLSGNLSSMACGLPYAIGAALAHPGRQIVAFVGDGGFSMLMAEFSTLVKYRLPVKVIILKNNSLGQIKWEQTLVEGHPEYSCDLEPIDFAAFARACGGKGIHVDDPAQCGNVIAEALETAGPVIVEAEVDPQESPFAREMIKTHMSR